MKAKTKMKTAKYAAGGANDDPIKDYLQKQKDKKSKMGSDAPSTTPNPSKFGTPKKDKNNGLDYLENASQNAQNVKKPGKIRQLIDKVKSNMQQKKTEKQKKQLAAGVGAPKKYGTLPPPPIKRKTGGATMYMTGGMANSNAKVLASKVAKGTVGGSSVAPKGAVPKAKYGTSMRGKKSC